MDRSQNLSCFEVRWAREKLTLVRFFNDVNRSELYQPNTFIYAWGSFLTSAPDDEEFHILLHAHSVDRDQEDTDSYFMHCPEAAQTTVSLLGVVLECGGQLNSSPTLLHYRLRSTTYSSSSRDCHTFPITMDNFGRIFRN
ncbi:hypothetical protein N7540_000235 [Penicillium herquei]|nr:hypothetical protein N7540_000235 [Penicillium herquei]